MNVIELTEVTREEFDKFYDENQQNWKQTVLTFCYPHIRGYYPKELNSSIPDNWVAQINYGEDGKEKEWFILKDN